MTAHIDGLRRQAIHNAAVVAIENATREVRAMVGSAAFFGRRRVRPGQQRRRPALPRLDAQALRLRSGHRRRPHRPEGAPAIAAIAGASSLPLERGINTPMTIGGRPDVTGTVEWRVVTPGYFRTLGIALRAGRAFEDTDVAGGPPVAIVNDAFARRCFPDKSPIGHRIEVGRFRGELRDPSRVAPDVEIVGIVADIREVSLRAEPRRTMYVPQAQAPSYLSNLRGTMLVFIARARRASGDVGGVLRQAIRAVDPALPRPEVFPFADVVARSLVREVSAPRSFRRSRRWRSR